MPRFFDEENRSSNGPSSLCDFSKSKVKWGWGICSLLSLITVVTLIAVSLKKLTSVEYGVQYDKWKKTLDDAAKEGGLHVGPPGYKFIKFPSTQITADLVNTCVSRDGLRVDFDVTFQYVMPAELIVDVVESYRDFKTWSTIVEAAGNSAVQHTCSQFNVTNFQTLRNEIQDAMLVNLVAKLEAVFALAILLQLRNVALPIAYTNAISSKQSAEEDIALANNQRTQEITKARTESLAALEEARKILDSAYNTGNVTLIEADLKAQETLFAFAKETEVLQQAQTNFNLSPNGILAYMTNQLYASTGGLDVTVGEPASISRKDLLLGV